AIRAALAARAPAVAPRQAPPGTPADDDELYERVSRLFETQVNPMVARHGGVVELIDVQDHVVMLRMGGGRQGCGMADGPPRPAPRHRTQCGVRAIQHVRAGPAGRAPDP